VWIVRRVAPAALVAGALAVGAGTDSALAAPTLSVSPRIAPAGTVVTITGGGCSAGDAVAISLSGPIVPPGPGGPVINVNTTADAAGAWSVSTVMPTGSSSVLAICGGQFTGGTVISSELTSGRGIAVTWNEPSTATLSVSGGVPSTSIDVLAADGRMIGLLTFDSSGAAQGVVSIPADVSEIFALGREFLLLEFPSPAAWRAVLPPRPEAPATTAAAPGTTIETPAAITTPDSTATQSTVPSTLASSSGTLPETGSRRMPGTVGVALGCCVVGAALVASKRRRDPLRSVPGAPRS
jgi:hypothetical protein